MKLNKNGWGITTELVFILIFVVCLIITTVALSQTGLLTKVNAFLNPNYYEEEEEHKDMESRLTNATMKYILEVYENKVNSDISVPLTLIKNGEYLEEFSDSYGECTGYTDVYLDESDNIMYKPYIKCKTYKTKGYKKRKDK